MTAMLQTSHRIYKRYQSAVESVIAAAGLGFLVGMVLAGLPAYPPNWPPVLIALVVVLALRWPLPACLLAVLIVIYPLYTVSLYVAILFVAVSALVHRPLSHYLGATVLILSVPLLAKYHLHWVVPILAGLWWGTANGFWMGAAASLWGKLLGGMAGLNIDWLAMAGQSPTVAGLMQRFNGLDALETLLKILQPFAPDATVLLYHLLQIAGWGVVGGLMGALARQMWLRRLYPWSALAMTATGALAMAAGHILLAGWLTDAAPAALPYGALLLAAVAGTFISGTLESARQMMELPLAPPRTKQPVVAPAPAATTEPVAPAASPAVRPAPIPLPELPEWEPPDDDNDLILLELD